MTQTSNITFQQPISEEIWRDKYRFGQEQTVQDTWLRVANALAVPEGEPIAGKPPTWAESFYNVLEGFKFLPAGRIMAGAGTERAVTLFNCFVMGQIPDSLDGIFTHLKEAALTMQQGGGIGYDFSTLRPKGAPVVQLGSDASGPLSFMDVWDAMCKTIMSAGTRRGAMMAVMRCDHPDIEQFIVAKQAGEKLRMFNVSVLCTDPFMEAVRDDKPWNLQFNGKVYRTVQARALWDLIMASTYNHAEPGVIFIDRINQRNNLKGWETIYATNPCGEQPLPPYGACLLGSINLTQMIDPSGDKWDKNELYTTTRTAIRMLDNVTDVSRFPFEKQRIEAMNKRRIGLGITGLASALALMGVRYDSLEGRRAAQTAMAIVQEAAYSTSQDLGEEKGIPPFLKKAGIDRRNSHLTSIAPTGTISLFAGNVSSGIEPIFARRYMRKVLDRDGVWQEQEVQDWAVMNGADPKAIVTASEMDVSSHVMMQAAVQHYVDSAVSKTINCAEDLTFGAFKKVYDLAYANGCKGCTTYRPNPESGRGAVLTELPEPTPTINPSSSSGRTPDFDSGNPGSSPGEGTIDIELDAELEDVLQSWEAEVTVPDRPERVAGNTYKIKHADHPHAYYVTINDILEGDPARRRPYEVFINTKNVEHYSWVVALTRMVSAVFRRGGDVSFVARELQEVFDPRGGYWHNRKMIPSVIAHIGMVVEEHMERIGYLDVPPDNSEVIVSMETTAGGQFKYCKGCGHYTDHKREAGCSTCVSCGYSECG